MTAQLPDTLVNRHPRVQFEGLKLYGVIRGEICEDGSLSREGNAFRTQPVRPEAVGRYSNLHRGYIASFVLERDGRLRLRSFRFRVLRTTQTQRVNEYLAGDFWMRLQPAFFQDRTFVPFRDGIIVEDREQWVIEKVRGS